MPSMRESLHKSSKNPLASPFPPDLRTHQRRNDMWSRRHAADRVQGSVMMERLPVSHQVEARTCTNMCRYSQAGIWVSKGNAAGGP